LEGLKGGSLQDRDYLVGGKINKMKYFLIVVFIMIIVSCYWSLTKFLRPKWFENLKRNWNFYIHGDCCGEPRKKRKKGCCKEKKKKKSRINYNDKFRR